MKNTTEAGDKYIRIIFGKMYIEHSGNSIKSQKFAIAVFLGHQNGTWKGEKEENRRFRPIWMTCEASGAQKFH